MVMHTLLIIFAFPDKNIFIWMCIVSCYILYVNNKNTYIYLKNIYAQIQLGRVILLFL